MSVYLSAFISLCCMKFFIVKIYRFFRMLLLIHVPAVLKCMYFVLCILLLLIINNGIQNVVKAAVHFLDSCQINSQLID